MAKLICVGSLKGGPGKTTISAALCVWLESLNLKVAGIDCDPSGAFALWGAQREATARRRDVKGVRPIKVHHMDGSEDDSDSVAGLIDKNALSDLVDELEAAGFDAIVIDSPGENSHFANHAHALSDMVITPVDMNDATAVRVTTEPYADAIDSWRKKAIQPEAEGGFGMEAYFDWCLIPTKVHVTEARRVMIPLHHRRIELLKSRQAELEMRVMPPLHYEPAHSAAMEVGPHDRGAGLRRCIRYWLESEVGSIRPDECAGRSDGHVQGGVCAVHGAVVCDPA